MKKTYKIVKDCFVGNVGDIVKVDTSAFCGDGSWENITQNKIGSPFVEWDLVEEVEE